MIDAAVRRYESGRSAEAWATLYEGRLPTPTRPPPLSPEAVAAILRMEGSRTYPARPEDTRGLNPGTIMYRGQVYDRAPLDEARRRTAEQPFSVADLDRAAEAIRRLPAPPVFSTPWRNDADDPLRRALIARYGRVELRSQRIGRQALERAGRAIVAWLIGRWRP